MTLALLAWLAAAGEPVSAERYSQALHLVNKLYLYPEQLDAERLLGSAARGLADDLPWLLIDRDGSTVTLSHGDGRMLGQVTATAMPELPQALARIEQTIRDSGAPLGDTDVTLSLLDGLTWGLDRYTRVLSGERLARFKVRLKGVTVGVGATLTRRDNLLVASALAPDGPAARGGLHEGDVLIRIDGRSTVNMPSSEAASLLQGEEGTQVSLEILRQEEEREYVLTRAEVTVPNVEYRMLAGDVGYVRITHVSQRTTVNLRAALTHLQEAGGLTHGLVLDLRGNTGGSMKEAARSADAFVEEGLLLRTVGPDGGRVPNLQARMEAEPSDDEPNIPIVIVVDDRTASGSEIIAGALLELERAALVGTRTYGKGTVQKTYTLDANAQLKLTVAQYLLANERAIAERGIVPDVVLGAVRLEAAGMRLSGWDEGSLRTRFEDVLPWVQEGRGWRGLVPEDHDLPLEIARQAVLRSGAPTRSATLEAVNEVAAEVRAQQERHLGHALEQRGLDWSPSREEASFIDATVTVTAAPAQGRTDILEVTAVVTNTDPQPLHRALIELSSSQSIWNGVLIPIGKVAPKSTVRHTTQVPLSPGIDPRDDLVTVRLRAEGRPPLVAGEEVLRVASSQRPALSLAARLVPHRDGEHRAEITVQNTAPFSISGVQVGFEYPHNLDVELVDHAAQVSVLPSKSTRRFDLALRLGPDAPETLPLTVEVAAERYDRILKWELELPTSGERIERAAPVVTWRGGPPVSAPTGPLPVPLRVTDEHGVSDIVVYVNGQKTTWTSGAQSRRRDLDTVAQLHGRSNRVVVFATDDHGIETKHTFVIRGEPPATADAKP